MTLTVMAVPDGSNLRTNLFATPCPGAPQIKLNAGNLALYPSTSSHQVTPVTRGTRLASFFWVQSMIRDSHQRTMLFDLDQSIQGLTLERGAADEQVSRLTGVYHNLVRLWGEI